MEQSKPKTRLHTLTMKVGKVKVEEVTEREFRLCLTKSFYHSSSSLLLEIQFTEHGNLQLHFYQDTLRKF